MKIKNSLKSLGVTLEELYDAKDKQIEVCLSDKPYVFDVVLKDGKGEPDCKISSFGANLWFRTPVGLKYGKYKTLGALQSAIVRAVQSKVASQGDITFRVSDKVCTF